MSVFVIPKPSSGNKTCQVLDIPLKPLNLHERIDSIDPSILEKLELTTIKMTGRFSMSDAHNWISNCLHDVPPNVVVDDQSDTHKFYFKSFFVGTYLIIELSKGSLIVQSDNLSVITILKEQLTQDATNRKIQIDFESEIKENSVFHTLSLLHPMIQE